MLWPSAPYQLLPEVYRFGSIINLRTHSVARNICNYSVSEFFSFLFARLGQLQLTNLGAGFAIGFME